MLHVLHDIIEILPHLMEDKSKWKSLNVTYAKPHVERIWRQHGDYRIMLHRIHPCTSNEALYHTHPWPSAVRIISGKYEMGVSDTSPIGPWSKSRQAPGKNKECAKMILVAGCEYEMTEKTGWHYVRPIDKPSDSIMVIGRPYDTKVHDPGSIPQTKQKPLTPPRFDLLFEEWKEKLNNGK